MNVAAVEAHVTGESPLSVGSYLRQKRNEKGMSQSELAKATDLSTPTIKNYESGRNLPPMDRAIRLGRVLGFDPKELMTEAMREMGDQVPKEVAGPSDDEPVTISRGALKELMSALRVPDILAERRSAEQLPPPSNDAEQDFDHAVSRLEALKDVINTAGLKSRKLPRMISDVLSVLDDLEIDELTELALSYRVPKKCVVTADAFEAFDDDEREGELDALSRLVIVAVIYDEAFFDADLRQLAKLERPLRKVGIETTYEEPLLWSRANELEIARKALALDLVSAAQNGRVLDVEAILNR
jgi:transcriptional regulator with XRE-family HTH domain